MKWLAAIICGLLILAGCDKGPVPDPHVGLTAQAAYDTCRKPAEYHSVSPFSFPISAKVMRHSKCLGIDDMLMVVWFGERSEKNMLAAKLLVMMYTDSYNDNHPDEHLSATHLKTDELKVDEEKTYVMFNQLSLEKLKK